MLLLCLLAADPVVVRLRPQAPVRSRLVRVGDLADLSGDPSQKERIARLDVGEFGPANAPFSVSAKQIGFRLRLEGVAEESFRIEGDSSHAAPRFRTVTAEEAVDQARRELVRGLPWTPEETEVSLAQAILVPLPTVAEDEPLVIKTKLQPGSRPPGRVRMETEIHIAGKLRQALAVQFEVRLLVPVAVCKRIVDRGQTLTAEDVRIERRPAASGMVRPEAVIGRNTKRSFLPGDPLRDSDTEEIKKASLVRAYESVKIHLRSGSLSIQAMGQALEAGDKGQLIQIRAASGRVVSGRVAGPSLVEVE